MGDTSTNKHYSDDAVRGWREGRRDERRRGREGRLRGEINGRKKERAFMCKRLCCVDIMLSSSHFFFVLIGTLLPKKTLYYHRHYR